ncbi:HEAT repeat domain-containing protein [Amycolatopsis sp. NPDC058340]|uniref:HEAT repeat domain-containing protein n=1 Tax=Amycolatopsis sp. NPDC058340 TaxID=3346453 RepID=UPI003649E77A
MAEALRETLESRGHDVGVLVDALVRADKSGDASEITAAFATITATPALVPTLDVHFRYHRALVDAGHRLMTGEAGPLTTAIAASHGNGRIRELAVTRMLASPRPEMLPFLLVRMTDWASPVRDVARMGVVRLLHDDPSTYLRPAAETMIHLRRRRRGGFGVQQLYAAAYDAPVAVLEQLMCSVNSAVSRFAFEVRTRRGDLKLDELIRLALTNPDKSIRARAGEAVAREAVWTGRVDALRKLAACRHGEVRISALTGLARLGHWEEIAGLLDDSSTLIRALARDAARRTGVDAVDWYRSAVSGANPSLGAIAGLAESGREEDGQLLYPLLRHPVARVRAQAVGALRILDAVPVEPVRSMVEDPSRRVVRAAWKALRTRA